MRPEYLALIISVVAVIANVFISNENRKHSLAKEEYFKLQQVVEKIIAKLLVLYNHQAKLKIFFENSYKATNNINIKHIDLNDTLSKELFDKNGEEITALIDIYFTQIGNDWNHCLDKFSGLMTLVIVLNKKIENQIIIDWAVEQANYNKLTIELGDKPKEIADRLKKSLKDFRDNNL